MENRGRAMAGAAKGDGLEGKVCRVFCEALPEDGVVEFVADRELRGGGTSWKGLAKAIVAEYVSEVPWGKLLTLEAVVVSDLPGDGAWAEDGLGEATGPPLLTAVASFVEHVLRKR
ncbi:unnamed protein product, partial [Discosporangium mesarthrocarpum]